MTTLHRAVVCRTVGPLTVEPTRIQRPQWVRQGNRMRGREGPRAWTGSWTRSPDHPSAVSAISAMVGAIGAGSACAAWEHAPRNARVIGSIPIGSSEALQVIPEGAGRCQEDPACSFAVVLALQGHDGMASRLLSPDRCHPVRAGVRVQDRAFGPGRLWRRRRRP